MDFYDFNAVTLSGETVPTSVLEGKATLVVTTVSDFKADPRRKETCDMCARLSADGYGVLAIPTQRLIPDALGAPTGERITEYAQLEVLHSDVEPLLDFLTGFSHAQATVGKVEARTPPIGTYSPISHLTESFVKFVVDKRGNAVARFEPRAPLSAIEGFIRTLR